MQVIKYVFQPHGDDRGQLVALEEFKDIPFRIKRVYYMYDTAEGVTRGKHAHKSLQQILICIHGSCKILLDNGKEKKLFLSRSHTKAYMSLMPCGERCMISLQMRYLWSLLQNYMMNQTILGIMMSFWNSSRIQVILLLQKEKINECAVRNL